MNEIFTIGDFCFRLVCPEELPLPANFMKFRAGTSPVYTYTLEVTDTFPTPEGMAAVQRSDLLVLRQGTLERRYIGVSGQPEPYACYLETSDREARILLKSGRLHAMEADTMFSSLLALERRQTAYDALILHCAYVEYWGEAILFSAPSGTGKTTQANLWIRYRDAETVNGDRALVQKLGGRWFARGWPVCGSSGVCELRDVPIRAVVTLSQAPADQALRLTPMKAFARLYSEVTVNRWDRACTLRAMELLEDLVQTVPVCHLECTMGRSAVETLEQVLNEMQ